MHSGAGSFVPQQAWTIATTIQASVAGAFRVFCAKARDAASIGARTKTLALKDYQLLR